MHINQQNHFLQSKKSHNFSQDCFKYLYLVCPSLIKKIRERFYLKKNNELISKRF